MNCSFSQLSFDLLDFGDFEKFFLSIQTRDISDSRPRGANNTYNRGVRGGSDRYAGRSGSTHFSSTGINMISCIQKFIQFEPQDSCLCASVVQILETSKENLQTRKKVERRVIRVLGLLLLEWRTPIKQHTGFALSDSLYFSSRDLGIGMQLKNLVECVLHIESLN